MQKKIGHYSFVLGAVLAIILGLGFGTTLPWTSSLLVVLGLIVGFLNVTGKETREFLLVSTALVVVASLSAATDALGNVLVVGVYLSGVFTQLLAFVVPATVVVALKDIYDLVQHK